MTNKGPFMRSGLGLTVQNRRSDFRVSGKNVSRLPAMIQPANLIKKRTQIAPQKPSSVSLLSFVSFALSVTYTFHVRQKRSTPSLATIILKDLAAESRNFQPTIQPMILTELAP